MSELKSLDSHVPGGGSRQVAGSFRPEPGHRLAMRIPLLDGLRMIACLSVVLFHYAFRGAAADDLTTVSLPSISGVAKYGFLGVQLFFMISGFAIAFSAQGRTAASFAIARLIRIYPGFLICMSTSAALGLAFADPGYMVSWDKWLANLGINAPFFNQGFVDGVYWSLVYELKFYVLFGSVLLLNLAPAWTMLLTLVWMLVSAIDYFTHPFWIPTAYLITDQSGFFAIGVALYELYRVNRFGDQLRDGKRLKGRTTPAAWRWAVPGLVLVAALIVAMLQAVRPLAHLSAHYQTYLSPVVVCCVVLVSAMLVAASVSIRRSPGSAVTMLAVGGTTYPLYLLHANVGFMTFNKLGDVVPHGLLVAGTTCLLMVMSWAVWQWLEVPAQSAVKNAVAQFDRPQLNYPDQLRSECLTVEGRERRAASRCAACRDRGAGCGR